MQYRAGDSAMVYALFSDGSRAGGRNVVRPGTVLVDPGPLFATLVANVGDAEIEGISAEFGALLWESLDFGFNVQLLDPKTTSDNPIVGTEKGARLPFSPEEKVPMDLQRELA